MFQNLRYRTYTVHFASVSPLARRLAMTAPDSPGPGRQIVNNTPRYTAAYNWVKFQRKIITYLITWDIAIVVLLHPHISCIFLGNGHFHGLIQFPKYSQFLAWYLLSVLLMCGVHCIHFIFDVSPWIKIAKPYTLEELKASTYQLWNWLYFGNWINPCECTFPKKMPEMCGRRRTFPTTHIIRNVIIFLCNFTQL